MKTSFDFESYRNKLAKELIGIHKNFGAKSAEEKLSQEKQTAEYEISKSLNQVRKNLSNNESLTLNNTSIEHKNSKVDFEEIDISEKIPRAIKLSIDLSRILNLENELDTSVAYKKLESEIEGEVKKELEKRGVEILAGYNLGYLKELVVNDITKGALFDSKNINTVIDATEHRGKQFDPRTETWNDQKERVNIHTKYGIAFNPDSYIATKSPGDEKNRSKATSTKEIYFSDSKEKQHAMMRYFRKGNQIIIVNPTSARFKQCLSYQEHVDSAVEEYRNKIDTSKPSHELGITFNINSQSTWADVAEWIVDLSAGKAYRIKDADSSASASLLKIS